MTPARQKLENLADALCRDVDAMSDEEIMAEELESIVETVGNQISERERGCLSMRAERLLVSEITRLRAELSAAKEAEAAAQLAVLDVRERAASVAVERAVQLGRQECCGFGQGSPPECCAQPVFMISDVEVEAAIRAMPLPPTPTVEKVTRLVEALKKFEARYGDDNGREDGAWDEVQAARSEVEALIGTPQQSKGG
jgi:hypothetical protein